jgi:hypothetical protein
MSLVGRQALHFVIANIKLKPFKSGLYLQKPLLK